jgi:nicotinate-nucleotide adenylyltransferase
VAGADDRLEMINLAVDGLSGITASDVELRRPGPSYTIDTVRHFKQTFADDASIYLILGLDAFLEINTWKSYRQLLEQIACIVVARPDPDYQKARQGWEIMEKFVRSSISKDFEFSSSRGCYASEGKKPIYIRDIQALDISATQIRKKVKNNQPIENLVPPAVAEYIQSKGLYQ